MLAVLASSEKHYSWFFAFYAAVLDFNREKRRKKRLDALQGESKNLAKRYNLTAGAIKIIERAGKIHEKIQNWFMETYFL